MTTTYRITDTEGRVTIATELAQVKSVVSANPGATVDVVVTHDACPTHPAFEAAYCPACGTARRI